MTVKELKKALEKYDDSAVVLVLDWNDGERYDTTMDNETVIEDDFEYSKICRIGINPNFEFL